MMISFWKLVILGVIVYWLWRRLKASLPNGGGGHGSAPADPPKAAAAARSVSAVDLEKCPKCGSYVSRGAGRGCARNDCPTF